MSQEKFCSNCVQRDSCEQVYRKLGAAKGPSVVCKVITAFLLPIVVFIVSLAAADACFAKLTSNETLRTILAFLTAVPAVFLVILITKTVNNKLSSNSNCQDSLEHEPNY